MTTEQTAIIEEQNKEIAELKAAVIGWEDAHQTAVDSWMASLDASSRTEQILDATIAELKAELASLKPSWESNPDARFRALDAFGVWHMYEIEPYENNECEYKGQYLDVIYWNGGRMDRIPNWRDTLEQRPEPTP